MATPIRQILTSLHGREIGLSSDRTLIVRNQVDSILITVAAGASNVCTATLQAQNNEGFNVSLGCIMHVWLSDAATGLGITANANTSEVTAGTGALLGILTTEKSWLIQTDATGKAVLSITDTGKHATYIAAQSPHRGPFSVASAVCVYGA